MAEDYQISMAQMDEIRLLAADEERKRLIRLVQDGYDDALIDGWTSHHSSVHLAWKTAITILKGASK
jgi:hypothetical protein